MMLFVVLLQCFIYVKAIQTDKTYLMNQIYQIMVVNMVKNWSYGYFGRYFIKFIGFMSIYYATNLDIISLYIILFYMIFNYLYLRSINLNQ